MFVANLGDFLWSLLVIFFMVMYFMIMFQIIVDMLKRSPGHSLDRDTILETLVLHLPLEHSDRVFRIVVGWGAYGNLFVYDQRRKIVKLVQE